MGKNNTRDLSMDIMRIIACVMVVGIHTAMEGWYNISPRSYTWTVLNFYDTVFRPAVPLFVMISGSLFLRKEQIDIKHIWLKNILRLFIIYVFWVVFYAVMNNGIHKSLADLSLVWKEITGPTPQYHLWYLRMLMNLYAISPLLWFLVRTMDRKMFRYYFGLFFVFGILRATLSDLPFLPKWILEQMNLFIDMDLVRYAGYFILGYFISVNEFGMDISFGKILTVYVITVFMAAGLNQWIAVAGDWPTQALYGNFSLPVALEAVCIFMLVRKKYSGASLQSDKERWILNISESTLFVYLIHPFLIQRLQIHLHFYTTNYNVLFSVPLTVLFVFSLASIAGMLLEKVPFLNRFL